MFEDSTFESTGRIKTRSRRWMLAAFTLNGSVLAAMVLVPLIYPNALPTHFIPTLLVAPLASPPETRPPLVHVRSASPHSFSELDNGRITAPPTIPPHIKYIDGPEPGFDHNVAAEIGSDGHNGDGSPFANGHSVTIVHPPSPSTLRLPSRLVESTIIYKTIPQYPAIAKAAGVEGTVVLQAVISKSGTIEHLQAVSGPPMLQQAAINAVKTWRYRPYLLNDQPIEVETTVSVIFKLGR